MMWRSMAPPRTLSLVATTLMRMMAARPNYACANTHRTPHYDCDGCRYHYYDGLWLVYC